MRFSNKPGQAAGNHPLDSPLGLGEEAGAEEHNHFGIDVAEPPKGFFAVHERHGKIEENQVEPTGPLPELFQTLKPRRDGRNLEAAFAKHALGQFASGRIIVDNQNSPSLL